MIINITYVPYRKKKAVFFGFFLFDFLLVKGFSDFCGLIWLMLLKGSHNNVQLIFLEHIILQNQAFV